MYVSPRNDGRAREAATAAVNIARNHLPQPYDGNAEAQGSYALAVAVLAAALLPILVPKED